MGHTKRLVTGAIALALTSALLASCSNTGATTGAGSASSASSGAIKLVIGQQGKEVEPIINASGVFANAPYQLQFASFNSPVDDIAAISSGSVDVGFIAEWTGLSSVGSANPAYTAANAPIKIIELLDQADEQQFNRAVIVASAKSNLTSVADAKGKKWGYIPGSYWNIFEAQTLQKLGWTEADISPVHLDIPNQSLALTNGTIDLAFTTQDTAATIPGARVIGKASDFGISYRIALWAGKKALDDPAKSAALQDFATRYVTYQAWVAQHPNEVQSAVAAAQKLTPDAAKTFWLYTRYLPVSVSSSALTGTNTLIDTAVKSGLLKNSVDASVFVDNRFSGSIDTAIKDTQIQSVLAESVKNSLGERKG